MKFTRVEADGDWNAVFEAVADPRRRAVLRVLEPDSRVEPAELASRVVAAERGASPADVPTPAVERAHLELEHVHLPKLEAAGLLTRDAGAVGVADHPALEEPAIDAILQTEAPDWDDVLAGLADSHRRAMLWALVQEGQQMDRAELARAVREAVGDEDGEDVTVEGLLRDMHHVHLPKLEAAGLVEFDAETVTYEGHPALDEEWMAQDDSETRTVSPTAGQPADT